MKKFKPLSTRLALLLISFVFAISCTEHEDFNLPTTISGIVLENGKLKFDNKASITRLMESETAVIESFVRNWTKNGFKPLRPYFNNNEENAIDDFLAKKFERIKSRGYLYSSKNDDEYELDLDDELISDAKFASILNQDREIYVGDEIYIYTTKGIFVSKISDEEVLHSYLLDLENKLSQKDAFSVPVFDNCQSAYSPEKENDSEKGALSLSEFELSATAINDKITQFARDEIMQDGCGGGGTGGGTGGGGTNTSLNRMPIVIAQGLQTCGYAQNSLYQSVFGNRVKCNDYHDGKHRVQTQFWNQNFLLWKTIGTKVKYQRKRFIGWSQSTAADYIELGINNVVLSIKNPQTFSPSLFEPTITFKYKGYTIDATGNIVQFPAAPTTWPFNNTGQTFLEIFTLDVDYGDVNRGIQELLGLARINLPGFLGLNDDLNNNRVGIRHVNVLPTRTEVIIAGKIAATTDTKYGYDFDLDFNLKWSTGNSAFEAFLKSLDFETNKVVSVDIYGLALKDGVIKGRRILGKD